MRQGLWTPRRATGASLLHYPQTVQRKDLRHRRPAGVVNPIEDWSQSPYIARPNAVLSSTGTTRVPSSTGTTRVDCRPCRLHRPKALRLDLSSLTCLALRLDLSRATTDQAPACSQRTCSHTEFTHKNAPTVSQTSPTATRRDDTRGGAEI